MGQSTVIIQAKKTIASLQQAEWYGISRTGLGSPFAQDKDNRGDNHKAAEQHAGHQNDR